MDMAIFLQRIFDALFNSAIYSSLALALVLIYRATGLLNFAQGELATFSAYVAFVLLSGPVPGLFGGGVAAWLPFVPWPLPFALAGSVVLAMGVGALVERVFIRKLEKAPELSVVNVSIGMLIAINALIAELWGTGGRRLPSLFPVGGDAYVGLGGARLRYQTIGVWVVLLVLLLLLALLLQRTKAGLAFRAVSINRSNAELNGIHVGKTLALGWALAAGLGALAAGLNGYSVLLEPSMMLRVLIYAFAAATLGGLDSPKGAIVGGILVGLSQTMVPAYVKGIGTELSLLPALLIMLLVLLVRPSGLYGTPPVERV